MAETESITELASPIHELFDVDRHYHVTNQVFAKNVRQEVIAISNKAYEHFLKEHGGGMLTPADNIHFLALLETWLASDESLNIRSTDNTAVVEVADEVIPLAVTANSLLWVTEALLAGREAGLPLSESFEFVDGIYLYTRTATMPNGDVMTIYGESDHLIEPGNENPVTPNLVTIQPSGEPL